ENAAGQAEIGRNRQREAEFGGLGDQGPAAEAVVGRDVARPGPADLEAAEVLAAEEETIDDAILPAAERRDLPDTGRQGQHGVAIAEPALQGNVEIAVEAGAQVGDVA